MMMMMMMIIVIIIVTITIIIRINNMLMIMISINNDVNTIDLQQFSMTHFMSRIIIHIIVIQHYGHTIYRTLRRAGWETGCDSIPIIIYNHILLYHNIIIHTIL